MAQRDIVLRQAAVRGVDRTDVLVRRGRIAQVGTGLTAPGAVDIDAAGGAVIPGLHDHHCHLLAMAAARDSVRCGPPEVKSEAQFVAALHDAAPTEGWIRGVGYHESVTGELDRYALDRARADVPVRVQHSGGSLWVLNSAGLAALGVDGAAGVEPVGVERDFAGVTTGRLWRCDAWLRERLGRAAPPALAPVSAQLSSLGVTGVTDATPDLDPEAVRLLTSPEVRQRLTLLGAADSIAPRKIVVSDHSLPGFDELAAAIASTRPRAVAVHCVTRAALALVVAALREVGAAPGDRIEHAAVVPPDLRTALAGLGLAVVTQPSLAALRGDRYLDDVEADDRDCLWPFASLLAAGIRVGCSSDAPYGSPDPWFAIAAATARRTSSGRTITPAERVDARAALRGYLTDPLDPGGMVRHVTPGAPADLVLLDAGLDHVLAEPHAGRVRLTLIGGEVVHDG